MCNRLDWFSTQKPLTKPSYCRVGDGKRLEIRGIGSIKVLSHVYGTWLSGAMNEVISVPGLSTNLYSVGAAIERGMEATFDKQGCRILRSKDRSILGVGKNVSDKIYQMALNEMHRRSTLWRRTAQSTIIGSWDMPALRGSRDC